MPVRDRLRNTAAAMGIAVIVSVGVVAFGVGAAGAQTATAAAACEYTVSPVIVRPPGATVTVQGFAPPGATVYVFVAGVLQPGMPIGADPVTGSWTYQFFASQTAEVTVSYGTQYPPTACGVSPEQEEINRQAARSLPRTGSDHVESTVLLALALIGVGAVLVVAVRRHEGVRGRGNS
jgi:LPXTG-motif cell wall-anchored protein